MDLKTCLYKIKENERKGGSGGEFIDDSHNYNYFFKVGQNLLKKFMNLLQGEI